MLGIFICFLDLSVDDAENRQFVCSRIKIPEEVVCFRTNSKIIQGMFVSVLSILCITCLVTIKS
jgi:hypothetical protein